MRKHSGQEVFRITGARAGLTEDVKGRQRRYVISMSIRTVCFVLAIALWHVQTVLAAIALVLGGILPYIAVVIANAGRENSSAAPPAFIPGPTRPELGRGRSEGSDRAPEPAQGQGTPPGPEHAGEPPAGRAG